MKSHTDGRSIGRREKGERKEVANYAVQVGGTVRVKGRDGKLAVRERFRDGWATCFLLAK